MRLTGLWWWIDRWRKSTAYTDMTLEQQGAYRNLLDEACLRGGPIPNDERILARACGDSSRWRRVRDVVMARFTLTDEGWRNATLDEVLAESTRRSEKQRQWRLRQGNGSGNARGNNSDNVQRPPDPTPDPIGKKDNTTHARSFDVVPDEDPQLRRAGKLLERYAELFQQHRRGARYHNRMHLDFPKACELVKTWPDDARLEKLAVIVLTTDDDWISRTDRGFGIFAARASWADDRLTTWEAEQQVRA